MAGGAVAGPYGAAIGGAVGGAIGLFSGGGGAKYDQELRNRLMQLEKEYGTPQTATANYSDFRRNQAALVAQQESMARGEGPSAAALQMREAMDRAVASQGSLAAGAVGRGVNAGAALRGAANNAAAIQAQGARDTGLARVNEQLGAMNQLGLTLHGARGMDESMNQFNAQQQNMQMNAARQAQLQALGMANGTYRGESVGMGDQILAGGANMYAGMLAAGGGGARQPTGGPQAAPQSRSIAPSMPWNPAMAPSNWQGGWAPNQSLQPQPWDPNTPVPRLY